MAKKKMKIEVINGVGIIPQDAKKIPEAAFRCDESLTSVTIPTSVEIIGWMAFEGCSSLSRINIPESVRIISSEAFHNCSKLEAIVIPKSVKTIGEINPWIGCSCLHSIEVSLENDTYDSRNNCNAIIETKTNILLAGCKTTNIPDSVTRIGELAFAYCIGLTSIVIPESVTEIGEGAFRDCTGLTSIVIPKSITRIERQTFMGCSSLTSIVIPESVNRIDLNAFSSCRALKHVSIMGSFENFNVFDVFYHSDSLETLTLGVGVKKVTGIETEDFPSLKSVTYLKS